MKADRGPSVTIPQDVAQGLFHQGATLVFLNVPVGTEFGIDYYSWNVGPKFKGVKMIPPGLHYVYYSAKGKDGQAPRSGFFQQFECHQVVVKKWDAILEDVSSDPISDEEQKRLEENKLELDPYLGVYPYDTYKKWVSLSRHLTAQLCARLMPMCGALCAVEQLQSPATNTLERQAAAHAAPLVVPRRDELPNLPVVEGTSLRFTVVPRGKYPPGASPAEVTKYSIDSSYALNTLLDSVYTEKNELLGELQFAFICFVIGQKLEAFDQWKRLIHLMCASEEALSQHPELFKDFISVLHYQVTEIPEDFFVDIISHNNFLTVTLQEFFSNLIVCDVDSLKLKGDKFRDHLERTFRWDFTTEPDDYAPVVVE